MLMRKIAISCSVFSLLTSIALANGVTADSIKVGASMSLTGETSTNNGRSFQQGTELYLSRINKSGGVHGRKIKLVVLDDMFKPQLAAENVRKLVETEKVFALLNCVGTPTSKAALPYVLKTGIPSIGAIIGTPEFITPPIKNVFIVRRIFPDEAEAVVNTIVNKLKIEKIAIFRDGTGLGNGGKTSVEFALSKRKLKLVADGIFGTGALEIKDAFEKIYAAKPDAVIFWARGEHVAEFAKLMKEKNWAPTLGLGSPGLGPKAVEALKEAKVTQAFFSFNVPFITETRYELVRQYLEDAKAAGQTPDPKAFETYLNTAVFHEALKRVGRDLTREKLIAAMESMNDVSIGGLKMNFSPTNHQGLDHVYMVKLENGELVSYDP